MCVRFTFHRVFAMLIVFGLLAVPGGSAFSRQSEPGQPQAPQPAPLGYSLSLLQEQQVSTTMSPKEPKRYLPQSAYDSQNKRYLVVWHNIYDSGHISEVYGQFIKMDGSRSGPQFKISSGPYDSIHPVAAYNSSDKEFLVLFMYDIAGFGFRYVINARRVNANTGELLGSEFTVEAVADTSHWSPRIAYNSNFAEYMAVWTNTTVAVSPISTGIGMKILDHQGNLIYGTILTGDGYPSDPDVTWDPQNDQYMVVWNFVNISGKNAIKGDIRDTLGNRVKLVDVFGSNTNNGFSPRVASTWGFGAGWFYVVFEYENASNDHDIYVWVTNPDGTITLGPSNIVAGTTHDTHPDIAGDPDRSQDIIVFQRADVFDSPKIMMVPFGTSWPANPTMVCDFFNVACENPSISFGGGTYLITYAEEFIPSALPSNQPAAPVKVRHIYNRMLLTQTLFFPIVLKP